MLLYKRVEWILQLTKDAAETGEEASSFAGEIVVSYNEKPGIQAIIDITPDLSPTLEHGNVARDYEYRRSGTV